MSKLSISCTFFIISFITLFQSSIEAYNVISFGAKPDGQTDSTQAFTNAWEAACKSTRPATINVPKGRFLIKPIFFNGTCNNKIVFHINGTIVAPSSYSALGDSGFWIMFYKVSGLIIRGGTFDAKGAAYWACRKSGKSCPPLPRSLTFMESSNIVVSGLKSLNSRYFHIAIDDCENITLKKLNIKAPSWSPNTDGIHIQSSSGISITDSSIKTGDDCISLGPGSKNLFIERIACGPGHGISIGSLGDDAHEDGVENVTVSDSTFSRTENGVRIKTWARPSNGFAKNINFQNIIMKNAYNPIIIDQYYCPGHKGCPNQRSGVKISGVTYKNIKGTSATKVAVNFDCSSSNPCTGIELQDINLSYNNSKAAASAYCKNAQGSSSGVEVPKSCL
ncbi:hypothetical protein Pint_26349 [Pistacia integerrima]|uniref:Uncharacterized protein n=1 Tax=Pistacia integerrima TaxID=434235 RepID=A0ACC0YAG2_9ROSI|nr:hypothetical protein Pint_26349 [Pistacia integerrima]